MGFWVIFLMILVINLSNAWMDVIDKYLFRISRKGLPDSLKQSLWERGSVVNYLAFLQMGMNRSDRFFLSAVWCRNSGGQFWLFGSSPVAGYVCIPVKCLYCHQSWSPIWGITSLADCVGICLQYCLNWKPGGWRGTWVDITRSGSVF